MSPANLTVLDVLHLRHLRHCVVVPVAECPRGLDLSGLWVKTWVSGCVVFTRNNNRRNKKNIYNVAMILTITMVLNPKP